VGIMAGRERRAVRGVRWKYVLLPISIAWLITFVEKVNVSLVIGDKGFLAQTHLAGHQAVLGTISGIFLLSYGISMYFWGWACDRWGARRVLFVAALIWAVSEAGFATAHSVPQLIAARLLLGVGEGFSYPVSLTLTQRWFPGRERSFANGLWIEGAEVGAAFAMPLFGVMIVDIGWPAPFWTLAIASLLMGLVFLWAYRDDPSTDRRVTDEERQLIAADPGTREEHQRKTLSSILSTGRFWLIFGLATCTNMLVWGLTTWIPAFLEQARHLNLKQASLLSAAPYLVAVVTMPLGGYLQSRFGHRAVQAFILSAISFVTLWIGLVVQNATAAAVLLGCGFGFQVVNGPVTANALLYTLTPKGMIGKVGGFMQGLSNALSFAGPFVVGFIIQVTGGRFTGAFAFMLAFLVIQMIICVALARLRLDGAPRRGAAAAAGSRETWRDDRTAGVSGFRSRGAERRREGGS
jgi:sugar phosphate permease